MCRRVIQFKDDERGAEGPRIDERLHFERHAGRHQRMPPPVAVNSMSAFSIRFPETRGGPQFWNASHSTRGTEFADVDEALTSSCHVLSLAATSSRGRNGSSERRVGSSACSL